MSNGKYAAVRKKGVGEAEAKEIVISQFERFGITVGPEVNLIVDDFAREHAKENKDSVRETSREITRYISASKIAEDARARL